jgi:hypothetical protein
MFYDSMVRMLQYGHDESAEAATAIAAAANGAMSDKLDCAA